MKIFVGYDPHYDLAYNVCKHSIESRSEIKVHKLWSKTIPEYNRNTGEPQSTDFTFTRFWVPYLSDYKGYSVFCDLDFVFLNDIQMLENIIYKDKAVSVVKHKPYEPKTKVKMDGKPQHTAARKNWASLMVFNNEHPSNQILTPDYLNNHKPGLDLHQFGWLQDHEIGALPPQWNVLDGYIEYDRLLGIHYTDGGPWLKEFEKTTYSKYWWSEKEKWLRSLET